MIHISNHTVYILSKSVDVNIYIDKNKSDHVNNLQENTRGCPSRHLNRQKCFVSVEKLYEYWLNYICIFCIFSLD